jgi:hypothetical protein
MTHSADFAVVVAAASWVGAAYSPTPKKGCHGGAVMSLDELEPIERASVDELRAVQLERLRWSLRLGVATYTYYLRRRERCGTCGQH